jgi:hypothetical protein
MRRKEIKVTKRAFHTLRRGQITAAVAMSVVTLISFGALAVDVGMLYSTKAELQRAADATALAGAWDLVLDERRLQGTEGVLQAVTDSRTRAVEIASNNSVLNQGLDVDRNDGNAAQGDLVYGWLEEPANHSMDLLPVIDTRTNAIRARARRDDTRNGPVPLMLARIFGQTTSHLSTGAVAAYEGGIVGFRVTEDRTNAKLLPFALHIDSWNDLISGAVTIGDNYAYNPVTRQVRRGQDGIPELNIFPGAGEGQLPPGNFGTVNIGPDVNSTAVLTRQILHGVTAEDLAHYGGELKFGEDGVLWLTGDTGLSAAVKDPLEEIVGQGRILPLFNEVYNPGNNATYSIVKFEGVRVMDVKLTGAMTRKYLVIQPAIVVDETGITDNSGTQNNLYRPPQLVR